MIKLGTVVSLKGCSRHMTVRAFHEDRQVVTCTWFCEHETCFISHDFKVQVIETWTSTRDRNNCSVGCVVQLPSGGPVMVVDEVLGGARKCIWFDSKGQLRDYTHAESVLYSPISEPVSEFV
jgi:uncharacterized protein YodC (DUF2158 family)